jgi:hypothetical protein
MTPAPPPFRLRRFILRILGVLPVVASAPYAASQWWRVHGPAILRQVPTRLLALMIDLVPVYAIYRLLGVAFGSRWGSVGRYSFDSPPPSNWMLAGVAAALGAAGFLLCRCWWGVTPGEAATGLATRRYVRHLGLLWLGVILGEFALEGVIRSNTAEMHYSGGLSLDEIELVGGVTGLKRDPRTYLSACGVTRPIPNTAPTCFSPRWPWVPRARRWSA